MKTATAKSTKPLIRWMLCSDIEEVVAIEASRDFPWAEKDFIKHLGQRNCIGMVIEHEGRVVGFMFYDRHDRHIAVRNFAVDERYRRQGFGKAMIDKLKNKLSIERRFLLTFEVAERNLDGQLFLRSQGFRAIARFRESEAYLFQYQIGQAKKNT